MYTEKLPNGKIKYIESYKDPYTEKRKRVSVILDTESTHARNKAAKILQDKIRQQTLIANTTDITFYELYQAFYDEWKLSVKYSTLHNYLHIDQKILDIIQDIPVKNLDRRYLQTKINTIFAQGYSTNTLKIYVGRIKAIIRYGLDRQYILNDSARSLKVPKRKLSLEQEQAKKLDYISQEDFKKVFDFYAQKSNKRIMRIVTILYLTGMRFGELQALTEDDIDFDKKLIHIRGTYDRYSKQKTTAKTKSSKRSILAPDIVLTYILDQIADNLLRFPEETFQANKDKYIFITEKGTPYSNSAFGYSLKANTKHFGFSRHISSHTFRHSHISMLAEMNIPLAAIMGRVGHTDSKTTIQIYTHVTQRMTDNLLNQLNAFKF